MLPSFKICDLVQVYFIPIISVMPISPLIPLIPIIPAIPIIPITETITETRRYVDSS